MYENVHDDLRAEQIARALAVASCNDIAGNDHALPMSVLRDALIGGTISFCLQLGHAMRTAQSSGADIAKVVAEKGNGTEIFQGKIVSTESRSEGGFTLGRIILSDRDGRSCEIDFKNENMSARIDGEIAATIPDLICVLDVERCEALTNPKAQVGIRAAVVLLPAPSPFDTPAGRALFGPAYIGLDPKQF